MPLPGLGSVAGLVRAPRGRARGAGSATPTTSRRPASTATTRAPAPPRCGPSRPGTVDVPKVHGRQVAYTSSDGTPVRMFVVRRRDRAGRAATRPSSTATAGSASPMTPGYSATTARLGRGRRRLRGRQPARRRRGGRELAPRRHARQQAERVRRLPRRRRTGCRQRLDDADQLADLRRLQRRAAGRRGAHSATRDVRGGRLLGAAARHGALRAVRARPAWSEEYGTASDADELGWLLAYSPYHHVDAGVGYPAVLFTVFDCDTRVDPLHARKMCAALQAAVPAGNPPIVLRRESDVGHGARRGQPQRGPVGRHLGVSREAHRVAAARLAGFSAAPHRAASPSRPRRSRTTRPPGSRPTIPRCDARCRARARWSPPRFGHGRPRHAGCPDRRRRR